MKLFVASEPNIFTSQSSHDDWCVCLILCDATNNWQLSHDVSSFAPLFVHDSGHRRQWSSLLDSFHYFHIAEMVHPLQAFFFRETRIHASISSATKFFVFFSVVFHIYFDVSLNRAIPSSPSVHLLPTSTFHTSSNANSLFFHSRSSLSLFGSSFLLSLSSPVHVQFICILIKAMDAMSNVLIDSFKSDYVIWRMLLITSALDLFPMTRDM